MEAATVTDKAPAGLPVGPAELLVGDGEHPGEQKVDELWKWQTWVHVGAGAENCEDVHEGDPATGVEPKNDCHNKRHFHAWIRLPNQFAHRECREVGQAAKGRRKRMLRDPESDAYWTLESDLEDIKAEGDAGREALIEELVGRDWYRDFLDAAEDVKEREVEDGDEVTKPFELIERDQERFKALMSLPEDERPQDETAHLERHIGEFTDLHEARMKELQQPKREAFQEQTTEQLLELLRRDRIEAEASAEFQVAYNAEMWFLCTARTPQGDRYFKSRDEMRATSSEVLEALEAGYNDLTRAAGTSGNS